MEIILTQDVTGLGYKNDVVKVKAGYGRNYLIPNGMALVASAPNRRVVAENVKQAAHKAEKIRSDAQTLAESIGALTIDIGTKAGESGKIFGAITPHQVSEALTAKGFTVDRKKISFREQPKSVGTYIALLELHKEVKHEIRVKVTAED